MNNKDMRLFSVWCAREALELIDDPDPRSINACDIAERYAKGEATNEELAAAAYNAYNAARDGVNYAAYTAYTAANGDFYDAAANAAANAGATYAAAAANAAAAGADATYAAYDAAIDAQIDQLLTYFN